MLLRDEAPEILTSLESSAENYHVAWKISIDRYGNKHYIINKHGSALFNLSKEDSDGSLSLQKLLDNLLKHIRALSGLGQPTQPVSYTHLDVYKRQLQYRGENVCRFPGIFYFLL